MKNHIENHPLHRMATRSLALLLVVCLATMQAFAQNNADMLDRVLSSVVTVGVFKVANTKQLQGMRGSNTDVAYGATLDLKDAKTSGSGFIIERNGKKYVITNAHVIENASKDAKSIYVFTIDRSKYEVKVIGGDNFYDFAVLEFITAPGKEVSSIKYRSTETRIGEKVFAIGNPLGEYPYTVSDGIISAKNRVRGGMTGKFGFIQSTATVIWGNSGGPLVDENGEVVGINSQIAFASRGGNMIWQPQINFALEASVCERLTNDILTNNGIVKRAYLGVIIAQNYEYSYKDNFSQGSWNATDNYPKVSAVMAGSPAYRVMATKIGWSVLQINGVDVRNTEEVLGEMEKARPNTNVKFTLEKDGRTEEVTVAATELTGTELSVQAAYLLDQAGLKAEAKGNELYVSNKEEAEESKPTQDQRPAQDGKRPAPNNNPYPPKGPLNARGSDIVLTACGISETTYQSMYGVTKLSELAAAMRFSALFGFYDIYTAYSSTSTTPTKTRIHMSGKESVLKKAVIY